MRLFRVISQNEKNALLEKGNTLMPHTTCKVPHWILNQHPEDYENGKYFFFEIEDALKFAKETYGSRKKCSLLEINIDKTLIFKYLGYGVYYYADYDKNGRWNNRLCHCIPEVLLPYQVVENSIKTTSYKLTEIDGKLLLDFHIPYNKHRSQELLSLGETVNKLCYAKKHVELCNPSLNEEYAQAKHEAEQLERLIPYVFEKFISSHRNYTSQLSDFLIVKEIEKDNLCK